MSRKYSELSECKRCGWKYPNGWLNPLVGSLFGTQLLCAICALAVRNAIHATNRQAFLGKQAQQLLEETKLWRDGHPDLKPMAVPS